MTVLKRNGSIENLDVTKIEKMVKFASKDFSEYNASKLIQELQPALKDGIKTSEIQSSLVQFAVELTSVDEPKWQFIAARLFVYDLYKKAALNRDYFNFGYGNFYSLVEYLTSINIYGDYLLDYYNEEDLTILGNYIKPERDNLFNYIGIKNLNDRYCKADQKGNVYELPQERFMVVAMHLAMKEKNQVYWAKKFYDVISTHKVMPATPTLNNAGTPFYQLSSCFIDTVGDNLWSIYNSDWSFANVSKHGGGQGIYMGKVRASNSDIRGYAGKSGGVVPWIKNYNNTAIAVDQLGVRQGAVAIYLDVWHKDILDFLNLKTNNGDDRMKAHDIFPGVCVPDVFMEMVKSRGNWYTFDPHSIKNIMGFAIEDSYDEIDKRDFTMKYALCVQAAGEGKFGPQGLLWDVVPAIDVMKKILASAFETGTPFIFYRDTVNRANPNKHAGMIYCSNLCTEIMQNMSETKLISTTLTDENGEQVIVTKMKPGDFVVCNLSSLNMGVVEIEELKEVTYIQARMLDNVIDLNFYPLAQAEATNQKYRPIGAGIMGWHHYLAKNKISWESNAHIEESNSMFELINYFNIKASVELAKEKGVYPMFEGSEWQTGEYFERRNYNSVDWLNLATEVGMFGVRNAWLEATAPTSSISLIVGTTAGIDPVFNKFWVEEKKSGIIPQTAPDLGEETFWYYKTAHTIDQTWSIKAAGARQRHIDQAQSFNLYITPNITAPELLNLYILAWEEGLKTIYYVRNQSLEIENCESCSS